MAQSLEEMFAATRFRRRMQIPEGGYFTIDGEKIYKMVSQNGDANQITVRNVTLEGGNLKEGADEKMYKYGEMVYQVEQN